METAMKSKFHNFFQTKYRLIKLSSDEDGIAYIPQQKRWFWVWASIPWEHYRANSPDYHEVEVGSQYRTKYRTVIKTEPSGFIFYHPQLKKYDGDWTPIKNIYGGWYWFTTMGESLNCIQRDRNRLPHTAVG